MIFRKCECFVLHDKVVKKQCFRITWFVFSQHYLLVCISNEQHAMWNFPYEASSPWQDIYIIFSSHKKVQRRDSNRPCIPRAHQQQHLQERFLHQFFSLPHVQMHELLLLESGLYRFIVMFSFVHFMWWLRNKNS